MNAYTGLNSGNNSFVPSGTTYYRERVSYDGNGNILSYLRNGEGTNTSMDNLSYAYNLSGGWLQNNKLRHVTDAVTTTPTGYGDLKNGQISDNYGYDAIGNLIKDESEGIASGGIEWNVYGKISQITKTNGGVTTVIKYTYDATGNRIGKWVQVGAGTPRQTAYVRDASGNVMAIYEKGNSEVNGGLLSQIEVPLYGSSRLGVWRPDREVETTGWELFDTDPMTGTGGGIAGGWERGRVQFELSNHLGNVLVTISDVRIPVLMPEGIELCDDPVHPACYRPIDYYLPQVLTANDYYPFGMGMPGRKYSEGEYRYGLNGQEKSTEIDPNGNSMTAEFWQYDARIGRRWNVDPISSPQESPYATFNNNPIWYNDPNGAVPGPGDGRYKIKKGDTFSKLEKKWGLQTGSLQEMNPTLNPKNLKVGQLIVTEPDLPVNSPSTIAITTSVTETKYVQQKQSRSWTGVLTFAGTASAADGPLPVGEVVGGIALVGYGVYVLMTPTPTVTVPVTITVPRTTYQQTPFYYITYTKINPTTGEVYVGRSSGYGTPQQIATARDVGHHMTAKGFTGAATVSTALPATVPGGYVFRALDPSYWAIRGSEQAQIEVWRSIGKSGNSINGIGPNNPNLQKYINAMKDILLNK